MVVVQVGVEAKFKLFFFKYNYEYGPPITNVTDIKKNGPMCHQ